MDLFFSVSMEVVYGIASLILISLGLAIIFGMMGVINLAHGEFLVMGSYATILATRYHVNVWIAIFIVAPLVVGLIGWIIERLIIQHLYGRLADTMLATWGLSMFLVGIMTTIFGNTTEGVPTPLPSFQVGSYQMSGYSVFVIAATALCVFLLFCCFRFTRWGLFARGTMQNAAIADALGINTSRIYSGTFAAGAALAGFAGGVLTPISGVFPSVGSSYIGKAFITVLGGGPAALTGTTAAAVFYGIVGEATTFMTNPVVGQVALLTMALILIRFLPQGITGRFFKGWL